jgi:hypothetical protein
MNRLERGSPCEQRVVRRDEGIARRMATVMSDATCVAVNEPLRLTSRALSGQSACGGYFADAKVGTRDAPGSKPKRETRYLW